MPIGSQMRCPFFTNFAKLRAPVTPVPLFNLKFVGRTRRLVHELQIGGSARNRRSPRRQAERARSCAGIDDRITCDRACMFPGCVAAGIAVMHVPDIAGDLVLQNHDVAGSNRRHARRRSRARKAAPVAGEIEFGNDATELVQRRFASTERVRASRRASTYDFLADLNAARDRRHRVQVMMPISQMMVAMMMMASFGSDRSKQQTRNSNNYSSH